MKKVLSVLSVMLLILASCGLKKEKSTGSLKVMSYNIRMGVADDGENSWDNRREASIEMLETLKPDVFGVQEAFDFQVEYITGNCRNYMAAGVGREDGKKDGEHMSILWNRNTIKMLEWGTFWLSDTPETPSMGWDAACKRTATWALMKDKRSGKKFYYVNTHLDHVGKEAQKNGLKLIVDRIDSINPEGYPMVLTGDFNILPDNEALADLDKKMNSARSVATKTDTHHTYNAWSSAITDSIIDYIYFSGFAGCPEYRTVTESYAGKAYISDHYPIIALLEF